MTRAVTGAVAVSLPHPPQARALVSSAPPAEAPPRRPPRLLVFVLSLVLALTTRARVRHGTPIIRPSVRMTAHFARADRDAPLPPARERARPRPPSGDIVTRRHDDANLGWQAAAAAPCVTEPPNPNPNDARMARMTRDPARVMPPNLPPHARERARPTPRPPPRPSPRPSPRRPTGRHQRRGRDRESERATRGVRRASACWPAGAVASAFKWPLRSPPHGKSGRAAAACVR